MSCRHEKCKGTPVVSLEHYKLDGMWIGHRQLEKNDPEGVKSSKPRALKENRSPK
jgi:hypothetical protein